MKVFQQKIFIVCSFIAICFIQCKCGGSGETTDKDSVNVISTIVKDLQLQLKEYPDSANLRLQLASVLDSLGMHKEAIIQMDSLTAKDNSNYSLWFTKGSMYEDAQDTLHALQCYARAASIYRSPDALLAIANLYAEQRNERALLICNEVQKFHLGREYDAHCAFIAGIYNSRTGNKQQALQLFDQCIAANYTYMEAYIEKGLVYFDNKQYDEALKTFQFGSTVNNLYADCYYYMGRTYEMMNKKDSAILRFKQALSLDPRLTEANERISRLVN